MQSEISISHVLAWGIREAYMILQLSAFVQRCQKWSSVMGVQSTPETFWSWGLEEVDVSPSLRGVQGLWHMNGRQGSVSPASSQSVTGLGCVKWSERRAAQRLVIFGVYQKAESLHREPESSCAVCLSLAQITATIHEHPLRVRRYFRYVEKAGCTKCHILRLDVEFPKFSASAKWKIWEGQKESFQSQKKSLFF